MKHLLTEKKLCNDRFRKFRKVFASFFPSDTDTLGDAMNINWSVLPQVQVKKAGEFLTRLRKSPTHTF